MITNGSFRRTSSVRLPSRKSQIFFSGYLRKQGKKFKSSKSYYFVLESDGLFYYTNSEKLRCVGTFPLEKGSTTVRASANDASCSTADRLFQINVDSSSGPHHQLLLSALNESERKAWIHALRKYLYLEVGGGIFGTHLAESFRYVTADMKFVPRVVYETVEFIKHYGIEKEGIFRKCGAKHVIQELADAYDCAQEGVILQPDVHDAHAAAGLLKFYLRELPEPVIPHRHYDRLKATGYQIDDGQDLQPIIEQLNTIPAPNYCLLQFLCQFLAEVAEHADKSRMTIENLATMFAPNILRLADEDPDVEIAASPVIMVTVSSFIRCHHELFTRELMMLSKLRVAANALLTDRPSLQLLHSPASLDSITGMNEISQSFNAQKTSTLPIRGSRNRQFWYPRDPHKFPTSDNFLPPGEFVYSDNGIDSALTSPNAFQSSQPIKPIDKIYSSPLHPDLTCSSYDRTDSPSLSITRSANKANALFRQPSSLHNSIQERNGCDYKKAATNQSEPHISNNSDLSQYSLSNKVCSNFFSEPGLYSNAPRFPLTTRPTLDASPNDPSGSDSSVVSECRQLRALVNNARAESACARAKAQSLQAELNRTRCDLNIAELEVSLLRSQLANLGIDVKHDLNTNWTQTSTPT